MDLGISGKTALVTAAGRGLGRSIALRLAREGVRVAVVSRTSSDIESVVEEMGGTNAGHFGIALDLTQEGAPAELLNAVATEMGSIDIAVHNLGGTLDIRDPYCSIEDWRSLWRLNVEVAVELNLNLLPAMRDRNWGRIVQISSIAATENQGPVPYGSVKAALTAYTRSMGRVIAPDGVVMTAVLPGSVLTDGGDWEKMIENRPDHVKKFLADRMAIRRFGEPDEIASMVAFLCSEHSSFCVGSIVPVDGGQGRGYFGL
jgi:NAD(P)-dependent dehydrogenase (short-subunit alcohol dehydrogenase family)